MFAHDDSSFAKGSDCFAKERYDVVPWVVPAEQPLKLVFFHKVFLHMRQSCDTCSEDGNEGEVPLLVVQRCFSRLCRLLGDHQVFDAKKYDLNGDGKAGWWEFLAMWKQEQFSVRLSPMERVYLTMEDPQGSRLGRLMSVFVLAAIFVSATSFILSTLPALQATRNSGCSTCEPEALAFFSTIDTVCVALFTLEYLTRLLTSAFMRKEFVTQDELIRNMCMEESLSSPTKLQRMSSFALTWPNVIDAMAILPSYFTFFMRAANLDRREPGQQGKKDIRFVIAKLTRLMRLARALRLGRRFEAVTIITHSMQRSVRAVWVLLLNISMGMLVWGATMFFLEQGDYDTRTGAFTRPEDGGAPSPFKSIPHSFWFALVTATTVGYGDVVPVSTAGRILAGFSMVYSLCVLALPIGVIGSNFEAVWRQFDRDKALERAMRERAVQMVKEAPLLLDPLAYSRRLVLEVFHSPRMHGDCNDIFLGEAEAEMNLAPDCQSKVERRVQIQLRENRGKCDRSATGEVLVSYSWSPHCKSEAGVVLSGELEVTVLSAKGLSPIDWKRSGMPDARVRLTFWPNSPSCSDGSLVPQVESTSVVRDDAAPEWAQSFVATFYWHKDGIRVRRDQEREMRYGSTWSSQLPCKQPTDHPGLAALLTREYCPPRGADQVEGLAPEPLAQLTSDVKALRSALPVLQEQIQDLQCDKDAIMALLNLEAEEEDAGEPQPQGRDPAAETDVSKSTERQEEYYANQKGLAGGGWWRSESWSFWAFATPDLEDCPPVPGAVPRDEELCLWT